MLFTSILCAKCWRTPSRWIFRSSQARAKCSTIRTAFRSAMIFVPAHAGSNFSHRDKSAKCAMSASFKSTVWRCFCRYKKMAIIEFIAKFLIIQISEILQKIRMFIVLIIHWSLPNRRMLPAMRHAVCLTCWLAYLLFANPQHLVQNGISQYH